MSVLIHEARFAPVESVVLEKIIYYSVAGEMKKSWTTRKKCFILRVFNVQVDMMDKMENGVALAMERRMNA